MNNQSGLIGLTWNKLVALSTAIIFPALGLIVTVVIFGTNIKNDVSHIRSDVDALKSDMKGIHTQVDTIERRQAIYQATHK